MIATKLGVIQPCLLKTPSGVPSCSVPTYSPCVLWNEHNSRPLFRCFTVAPFESNVTLQPESQILPTLQSGLVVLHTWNVELNWTPFPELSFKHI